MLPSVGTTKELQLLLWLKPSVALMALYLVMLAEITMTSSYKQIHLSGLTTSTTVVE